MNANHVSDNALFYSSSLTNQEIVSDWQFFPDDVKLKLVSCTEPSQRSTLSVSVLTKFVHNAILGITYCYMAVSHRDWKLPYSRI